MIMFEYVIKEKYSITCKLGFGISACDLKVSSPSFLRGVCLQNYCYRVDKSTIFGMRGLWGLTVISGRGAMLKYLWDGRKIHKN